ncbi:MAG: FkbM family methyltransferase [Candidatus Aenigmarchaeota archaeon]
MGIVSKIWGWMKLYKNWYIRLFEYRILKDGIIQYKLRNGINFIAQSGYEDSGTVEEIWGRNVYCPKSFEITNGNTVLDLGAQKGIFSLFAATRGKDVNVYSYEPCPNSAAIMRINTLINKNKLGNSSIKIRECAVTGKRGEREMFCFNNNTGFSGFYNEKPKKDGEWAKVKCTTLKDIFQMEKIKFCDFLKMDVEGSEYEILENAPENILKRIGLISMEYHSGKKKLSEILKDHFDIIFANPLTSTTKNHGFIYAKNKSMRN